MNTTVSHPLTAILDREFTRGKEAGVSAGYNLCLSSLIRYRDAFLIPNESEYDTLTKAISFVEDMLETAMKGKS